MPSKPSFKVRAFQADDARAFERLNRHWIEEYFGMEDEDHRVLGDPDTAIIAPGGYIAIAEADGEVIGTGALIVSGANQWVELVKMATDPDAQGRGVASTIIDHLIEVAKSKGAKSIWLETNDRLVAATRLYRRKGFRSLRSHEEHPTPYSRCNLQMLLELE